jgi:hypothetical protein
VECYGRTHHEIAADEFPVVHGQMVGVSSGAAELSRERPANNPIGNRHLEMDVALDAWNRLVTDLWGESWSGIDVDLLFGLTA